MLFFCSLEENYPDNKVLMDVFNIYGGLIHNGFELTRIFGIEKKECSAHDAIILSDYWPRHFKKNKLRNRIADIRRVLIGVKDSYITQDDPTAFYPEIYNLSPLKSYLFKGNWVNENYLKRVENRIRKDFTFPSISEDDYDNYCIQCKIRSTESVAVHVRLGDYLNSGMLNLTYEYYTEAKRTIEKYIKSPHYYIFSDQIDCIDKIKEIFPCSTIVTGNKGNDAYKDMQLMSECKHNIIANSTFSFWGAYLNNNDKKIVIAPNKAHPNMKYPFACSDWILVEV